MKISVVLPVMGLGNPFLFAMTEFAIKALQEHADNPFELIVVEAQGSQLGGHRWDSVIDKYLSFNPPIGGVREINRGIDCATGDYIVFTGNDVIVPPHWDTELLLPFERFKDCGISTLAAKEPGVFIGPPAPVDLIVEGMFSPFCMFKKGWKYDESFERIYQDSDLVMRMYDQGLRAYRNCRTHVLHLGAMTNSNLGDQHAIDHARLVSKDEEWFYKRWGGSPLAMFGMIRKGYMVYGREYESFLAPIQRH
jgi:GT2 family glycosyltransferase